jgi:uncharacterized protein (TIGR00106 family)
MSVLLEFAMFPTDKGESVSDEVSKVIAMIRDSGVSYKLSAMGTIIETDTLAEALNIVQKSNDILEIQSNRIYSSIKLDIRKNTKNRLETKIQSIQNKIGNIDK